MKNKKFWLLRSKTSPSLSDQIHILVLVAVGSAYQECLFNRPISLAIAETSCVRSKSGARTTKQVSHLHDTNIRSAVTELSVRLHSSSSYMLQPSRVIRPCLKVNLGRTRYLHQQDLNQCVRITVTTT